MLALGEDHRGERFDKVEQWCIANGKEVVRLKRTQEFARQTLRKNLKEGNNTALLFHNIIIIESVDL